MSEKLCVFCRHFYMLKGCYFSDVTYDEGEVSCHKEHWDNSCWDDAKDFRAIIVSAKNCKDYVCEATDNAKPVDAT